MKKIQEAYDKFKGIEIELPNKQCKGIVCGYDNNSLIVALTQKPEAYDGWKVREKVKRFEQIKIFSNHENELGYWFVSVKKVQEVVSVNSTKER